MEGAFKNYMLTIPHRIELGTYGAAAREKNPKDRFGVLNKDLEKIAAEKGGVDAIFEPSAAAVLDALLPYYAHFAVYRAVVEARAAEHSARMVAMKSATDNAKQLIKDLTLEYNKVRQAAITTELLEITTAQMALG